MRCSYLVPRFRLSVRSFLRPIHIGGRTLHLLPTSLSGKRVKSRMQSGVGRCLIFGAAFAYTLFVLFPSCAALGTAVGSTPGTPPEIVHNERHEEHDHSPRKLGESSAAGMAQEGAAAVQVYTAGKSQVSETKLIRAIDIPFKYSPGQPAGMGISMIALGEPKSGTTWLGRVIVELCVQICGNPENTWCKMGGLKVVHNRPAPYYEFEMLHADTDELFLHFEGAQKHVIPGLGQKGCDGNMISHCNSFGKQYPCKGDSALPRGGLVACLPGISQKCILNLSPLDPAQRRIAVIFRDARNLIISEHRMRREVYNEDIAGLEQFIFDRFETVVAWIHQRYTWHTTALEEISHVMFYEDLQTQPHHLADLAAFLGLDCTPEKAEDVFRMHAYTDPPGDYTTYGLPINTLEWMNTTMSKVLPEALLARYGLTPIWE
ncbi:unnamed protein product [Scytosiphon promiscuus]